MHLLLLTDPQGHILNSLVHLHLIAPLDKAEQHLCQNQKVIRPNHNGSHNLHLTPTFELNIENKVTFLHPEAIADHYVI